MKKENWTQNIIFGNNGAQSKKRFFKKISADFEKIRLKEWEMYIKYDCSTLEHWFRFKTKMWNKMMNSIAFIIHCSR